MNLIQIKYFIEVAKNLNFTKAAEQLYVSQPALSRHISNMETELNMQLFIRNKREIKLTPAGKVLYNGLKDIYDDYNGLLKKARDAQFGISYNLKIGILDGENVGDFMPSVIKIMRKEHPNIEITLQSMTFNKLVESLYSGSIDISFDLCFNVIKREQLQFKRVSESSDFIAFNKEHKRLADKDTLTLSDLKEEQFVLISPEDSKESVDVIKEACRKQGFEPKIKFAPNLNDQILWVKSGLGIAIFDSRNCLIDNPRIMFRKLESEWDPSMVVVWHRENSTFAIPEFLKVLKRVLDENNIK